MKTFDDHPNFSVVVPGGCNAECDFCWWQKSKSPGKKKWLANLAEILPQLPEQFKVGSITGSEPSLCKWLPEIAELMATRFPKIVLTTNGAKPQPILDSLEWAKHVTLSRHHWRDDENRLIFKTSTVPGTEQILNLTSECNRQGVDVSLSAILPSNGRTRGCGSLEYLYNFVDYAKLVWASSMQFRKTATKRGALLPHMLENNFRSKTKAIREDNCPVCRSAYYFLHGLPVIFKASAFEPSDVIKDSVYELIYQQDGTLTSDWGGKLPVELESGDESLEDALAHIRAPDVVMVEDPPPPGPALCEPAGRPRYQRPAPPPVRSGGGCGGFSGGGCG